MQLLNIDSDHLILNKCWVIIQARGFEPSYHLRTGIVKTV